METKADFHTFLTDAYDIIFDNRVPIIGGRSFRGLYASPCKMVEFESTLAERLLAHSFNSGKDTLVGITNFDDDRAQRMMLYLKILGSVRSVAGQCEFLTDPSSPGFVRLKKDAPEKSSSVTYLLSQEISTDQGHVLVVGADRNISEKKLEEVLKRAKGDHNALIFGNHALQDSSLKDRFNSFVNRGGKFSLSQATIEKYASYFDAISVDGEKQEKVALECNISLYASSGSHRIEDIFSSYTSFSDLDFSTKANLLKSVRTSLRNRDYAIISGSNGVLEPLRIPFSVGAIHLMGLKTGLLKRDYE